MNIDYDAFYDWTRENPFYEVCDNIKHALYLAYKNYDLSALKHLTANFNCEYYVTQDYTEEILDKINDISDIEFLKWIFDTHTDFDFVQYFNFNSLSSANNIVKNIVRNNRHDILRCLFEYFPTLINYNILRSTFRVACRNNTPHTMSYLYNLIIDKNVDDSFVNDAILNGNPRILLWMIQTGKFEKKDEYITYIVDSSCRYGNIYNLIYVFKNWPTYFNNIDLQLLFKNACLFNHIEVASWLKHTFLQIDVKFNNNEYFYDMHGYDDDHYDEAFGRHKWLLTFYQSHELAPIINNIYAITYDQVIANLIQHIIMHFDVDNLVIDAKYQSEFDATIASTNRVFAMTKSAK